MLNLFSWFIIRYLNAENDVSNFSSTKLDLFPCGLTIEAIYPDGLIRSSECSFWAISTLRLRSTGLDRSWENLKQFRYESKISHTDGTNWNSMHICWVLMTPPVQIDFLARTIRTPHAVWRTLSPYGCTTKQSKYIAVYKTALIHALHNAAICVESWNQHDNAPRHLYILKFDGHALRNLEFNPSTKLHWLYRVYREFVVESATFIDMERHDHHVKVALCTER